MNSSPTAIGEAIRSNRLAQGLTLQQLADGSGVTLSHLSNFEHGRRIPGLQHVQSLADCLHLSATERRRWLVLAGLAHIPSGLREAVEAAVGLRGPRQAGASQT